MIFSTLVSRSVGTNKGIKTTRKIQQEFGRFGRRPCALGLRLGSRLALGLGLCVGLGFGLRLGLALYGFGLLQVDGGDDHLHWALSAFLN